MPVPSVFPSLTLVWAVSAELDVLFARLVGLNSHIISLSVELRGLEVDFLVVDLLLFILLLFLVIVPLLLRLVLNINLGLLPVLLGLPLFLFRYWRVLEPLFSRRRANCIGSFLLTLNQLTVHLLSAAARRDEKLMLFLLHLLVLSVHLLALMEGLLLLLLVMLLLLVLMVLLALVALKAVVPILLAVLLLIDMLLLLFLKLVLILLSSILVLIELLRHFFLLLVFSHFVKNPFPFINILLYVLLIGR